MPRGLPSVEQQFSIDATGYRAGRDSILGYNRDIIGSVAEVVKQLAVVQQALGSMPGDAAGLQGAARHIGDMGRAAGAAAREIQGLSAAHGVLSDQVGVVNAQIREQLSVMGRHESVIASVTRAHAQAASVTELATAGLQEHTRALGTGSDSNLTYVTSLGAVRDTARDTTSALADTAAAVAATRTATASATADFAAYADAQRLASAAENARFLQQRAAAGSSGAASNLAGLLARYPELGGGGPGGGGGGAGGGGGFHPAQALFGGALPTVKMAHMIVMATMESLSTIIPAAVAAGAAGAVGLQGGVNAYTSGTGLYNATEALGGAYGKTFGSYLGLGSSFQAAQNQANGGVYGIAGGVLNMAGQGRDAFSNMGVQTVGMIDRGIASMVLNNRMSALSNAVSGGTGDLRAFGDVGANIGDTLLNLAPNLPGLGPDLLNTLKGVTGAASFITGHAPAAVLGAGLAAEAGYRWGDLALSGGKMPWFLGGGRVGGLAGVAERMGLGTTATEGLTASDIADAGGMGIDLAGLGGAGAAGGTGLAGILDAAGGPGTMGLAAAAWLVSQAFTPGAQKGLPQQMGMAQGAINQSFGANAWKPIQSALYKATAAASGTSPAVTDPTLRALEHAGAITPQQAYARQQQEGGSYAQQFGQQLGDLVAAGPQAVKVLQDIGVKGASVSQAFDIMTEAMVPMSDIGAGGKINADGRQLMKQFMTVYAPMVGTNAGAIGEAASAQDVMSSSAMKSLSSIQQAADGFNQIMMAGAATAAQTTTARLGLAQGFGKALGQGPFTAAGAAAATQFETGTSTQPGVISSLQSDSDQLKTFLTLGALNTKQTAGIGGYEISQFLGPVQQSGSGQYLAQMMEQARQMGVPGVGLYNTKQSFAQNFASFQKAVNAASAGQGGATGLTNKGGINLANLPKVASSLITSQDGTSPLDSQTTTNLANQALSLQQQVATQGWGSPPAAGSLSQMVATLMAGGVKGAGSISASLKGILGQAGIGGSTLSHLVQQGVVDYKAEYERTDPPPLKGAVTYHSQFVITQPPVIHGVVIYNAQMAGLPGGIRIHGQSGFKVPGGYGGGDTVPAMLEPGEAVVPKHLVPQLAPFLGANKVPGFAAGGLAGLGIFEYDTSKSIASLAQAVSGLASAIGASGAGAPMPAAAQKVFNAYDATLPKGIWGQFASQMLQGLIDGVKNAPHETAKMAQAIVSQVTQAVTYGQGVAAAAKQGGGYNPWGGGSTLLGTFGNLATPTTTAGGQNYQYYTDQAAAGGGATLSVQQQMGDYLQAMKSFQGDLGKLSKAGLNKNLMQQLLAAGPLQGDQEAQSILGGAGGAKGANQLWGQINAAANQLGTSSASALYGGGKDVKIPVHADTAAAQAEINKIHGKSVVISVNLAISGGGGGAGGGGAGGEIHLSPAQVKAITEHLQAKLLQRAKNNRATNLKLPGYGS